MLNWRPLALAAAVNLPACGPSTTPPPAEPVASEARPEGHTDQRWGQELAHSQGCIACHALQAPSIVAPPLDAMASGTRTFQDGSSLVVSGPERQRYLRSSITSPSAQVVMGFNAVMPVYALGEAQLTALVSYLECFGEGACEQVPGCAEVDPCRPR
jgi:mono/diheme cytochrome c family protein